ncbi:MAG: hemerythrin family protein [candidate division Zixibacteria bacterium]|nr:hemerythrin family protein [candidate division Zixibacteria bacterium]
MVTKWSYKLLTGNEMIDKQHKEIFDRAAQMLNSGRSGKTKEEAASLVSYLEGYYDRHFAAEEALQKKHGYPDYQIHKDMHDRFSRGLTELKLKYAVVGASYGLAIETVLFMLEWLAGHIDKMDKAFASYIRDNQPVAQKPVSKSVRT